MEAQPQIKKENLQILILLPMARRRSGSPSKERKNLKAIKLNHSKIGRVHQPKRIGLLARTPFKVFI